jgi:adenylate kinase family enzyme
MIVNLVGPPAAGKSTFAARFVAEHPYFRYCTIDAYRQEHDEEEVAWAFLLRDMVERRDVVLESCGLDWRLMQIFDMEAIRRRPILTICFDAPYETLLERVSTRQKGQRRGLATERIHSDEKESVRWVQEHLEKLRPVADVSVDTGVLDEEEVHSEVAPRILEFRIKNETRKFGRRRDNLNRRKQ